MNPDFVKSAVKTYSRKELQYYMIVFFKSNVGRFFRYLGITTVVRQIFYAVSWVLEGISIGIYIATKKYHAHNCTGNDLLEYAKDIRLPLGLHGNKSWGYVLLVAPNDTGLTSFQIDASLLDISIFFNGENHVYECAVKEPVSFSTDGGLIPRAIVKYVSKTIGKDHDFPAHLQFLNKKYNTVDIAQIKSGQPSSKPLYDSITPDFIIPELVASHERIEKIVILGTGLTGGTDKDYSDTELLYQIQNHFDGMATSNKISIEKQAKMVPGVVYATAIGNKPTPGENTLFIADWNGKTNTEILSAVKSKMDGDGDKNILGYAGLGIPINYKAAIFWLMYYNVSLDGDFLLSEKKTELQTYAFQQINQLGINPSINPLVLKQIWNNFSYIDGVSSQKFYYFKQFTQINGVDIVGASTKESAWKSGDHYLRYNPSTTILSFSDGIGAIIQTDGGGLYTLHGSNTHVWIIVNVNPALLPTRNMEEKMDYVIRSDIESSYVFSSGDIVRLPNKDAISINPIIGEV